MEMRRHDGSSSGELDRQNSERTLFTARTASTHQCTSSRNFRLAPPALARIRPTSETTNRVPAAYDTSHSPTVLFRKSALNKVMYIGDPRKAARAMVEVAGMADPPLRVQLGTDSLILVRNQARHTLMECDRVEELAHSTNMEGVDRTLVMENLSAANL